VRNESNYRIYDDAHVERLRFIRHCRSLDMSLDETRFLLNLREKSAKSCDEVDTLLDVHLLQVDTRIQALLELKKHLLTLKDSCSEKSSVSSCGILRELSTGYT
jgi:DNA-binding transcriptional MerR regulator